MSYQNSHLPFEYSCGSKSQIQKFGNQSSGTRKSPFLQISPHRCEYFV